MSASTDAYKAGRLQDAITAQVAEVKAKPADQTRRLFLFELLAFAGELDRARRQVDAIKYDDPEQDLSTGAYRKLLDAEEARRKLFRDGVKPAFLAEPPEHVHWRLEALNCLRGNQHAEAAKLLEKANAAVPTIKGLLNGKPFDGLRDGDDLFGSVLEVLAQGRYFWVPLEQVETLAMNEPKLARDLLWIPARMEMSGSMGEVFLSALYPGSHEHPDDQIKLARATDWKPVGADGGPMLGVGIKTFLVGEEALPLLEWRELQIMEA